MPCGFDCSSADDGHLWTCNGICKRQFHAACVGVKRNQEAFSLQYLLPICADCREQYVDELNLKKLYRQQTDLNQHIQAQIEANHALIKQVKNLHIVHESIDNLESMVISLRDDVAQMKSRNTQTVASLQENLSLHFDDLTKTINNNGNDIPKICDNSHSTEHFRSLSILVQENMAEINNKINDFHHVLEVANNGNVSVALMDELKSLSIAVSDLGAERHCITSAKRHSLSAELLEVQFSTSKAPIADYSGWRILGTKKIWKPDWREYDNKQITRAKQEKLAHKARQRKKTP